MVREKNEKAILFQFYYITDYLKLKDNISLFEAEKLDEFTYKLRKKF